MMVRIEVLKVGKGRRGYTDWESVRVVWRSDASEAGEV